MPGGPCWADCCNFLHVGWHPRRNHAYQILSRSRRGLRSYGGPKSAFCYAFLNGSYNSVTHYRATLWCLQLRPNLQCCTFPFLQHRQGGHNVGEKNSLGFPGFSRAKNLLFLRLLQQKKINVIMTFVKGHDDPVYPVNSCFTQIFDRQSKNTLFVTIFPRGCTEITEFLRIPSFPCSEKSLSIPGFPGLWPPVTSARLWQREFDLACPKPSNQSLNLIL